MSAVNSATRVGCLCAALVFAACSSADTADVATDDASPTSSVVANRAVAEPEASSTTSADPTRSSTTSSTTDGVTTAEPASSATTTAASTTSSSGATTTIAPSTTASTGPATTASASTTIAPTTTSTASTTTTTTATTTAAPQLPGRVELPAAVGAIEGVATDATTGRIFVGDLNTGNVWVGTASTDPFELFSSAGAVGRSNALGLATDEARRRLYVVSMQQGRVDEINLDSGAHVRSIAIPGAASLNDVAVAPDGTLYVSDLGRPVVYRIAAGGSSGEVWVDYSDTSAVNTTAVSQHGNGIVADDQVVLLAYMIGGELLRFDRSTGAVTRVTISGSGTAGRDGLALCGSRLYGVDPSWLTGGADRVWATNLDGPRSSGSSTGSITSTDFSGISTVAPLDGSLVVANAQFGVSPKTQPFWLTVAAANC